MSVTFYTPADAKDISFTADGQAVLDITAYSMKDGCTCAAAL